MRHLHGSFVCFSSGMLIEPFDSTPMSYELVKFPQILPELDCIVTGGNKT